MNCVLFAKMDQVFSKENKTLKKYWKIGKKIREKSGNFVSLEKWEPCSLYCPNDPITRISVLQKVMEGLVNQLENKNAFQ